MGKGGGGGVTLAPLSCAACPRAAHDSRKFEGRGRAAGRALWVLRTTCSSVGMVGGSGLALRDFASWSLYSGPSSRNDSLVCGLRRSL